jgi:hypothetical protein
MHTGLVVSVDGSMFTTIEGNTTQEGGSEAVFVASHTRDVSSGLYYFVRYRG